MTSLGDTLREEELWRVDGEPVEAPTQEEPVIVIRTPGFRERRSSALERFNRRVQQIRRAVDVGAYGSVFRHARRRPDRRDGRLSSGPLPQALEPEALCSVPFGLKKRVAVGFPVFRCAERRLSDQNRRRDDERREQIRRAIRQTALHLLAEMMEIEALLQGLRHKR